LAELAFQAQHAVRDRLGIDPVRTGLERIAAVLQGTVRRAGNRLRVSVQLIDAKEAMERWSQTYDQDAKDAFAVQDSITRAIVDQLALTLGGAELAATRAGRTTNSEAHDLYLQGLALVHQGTEQALRRGLDFETSLWMQRRYRLLFALVGLAMLVR
jgi:hypothetical protein